MKVILRFLESMARDMRHPYIPSTTVLGDKSAILRKSDMYMYSITQRHLHAF